MYLAKFRLIYYEDDFKKKRGLFQINFA